MMLTNVTQSSVRPQTRYHSIVYNICIQRCLMMPILLSISNESERETERKERDGVVLIHVTQFTWQTNASRQWQRHRTEPRAQQSKVYSHIGDITRKAHKFTEYKKPFVVSSFHIFFLSATGLFPSFPRPRLPPVIHVFKTVFSDWLHRNVLNRNPFTWQTAGNTKNEQKKINKCRRIRPPSTEKTRTKSKNLSLRFFLFAYFDNLIPRIILC